MRALPVRLRARATYAALAFVMSALIACQSPPTEDERDSTTTEETDPGTKSADLTIEDVRELIQKGALRPVEAMPEDSTDFADPNPDAPSFDQSARALEDALREKKNADAAPQPASPELPPENPYLVFGKRIVVYAGQGLISKPFPLRVGLGPQMKKLLDQFGNFPLYDPKTGPQKPDTVRIDLLEKWDQELFADLRSPVPNDGNTVNVADWLVVTAGFEQLREVQGFIEIFAAGVPQIEIEAKIVEVTTNDTLDLGIKPIDATTPIFGFPDHTFVKALTYSLPNQATGSNSLLTLGGVQDGLAFNMALQAIATLENVSIISRPKIAVREGGRAEIVNTLKLPNYNVNQINAAGQAQAALTYEEVGIKLYVVPRVVGTRTVALNIDIEASAQSGSSVSFVLQNGQAISNPIISRRAAKTVVYLEPGQAVILGGLISERLVDSENKVPFLGDIPILGYLFKSTFKRKEQTNVLFFIRPRILQGSDLNRDFSD